MPTGLEGRTQLKRRLTGMLDKHTTQLKHVRRNRWMVKDWWMGLQQWDMKRSKRV